MSRISESLKHPWFSLRRLLFGPGPILNRLNGEIDAVQAEYDRIEVRGARGQSDFAQRLDNARKALDAATRAAADNNVNGGWSALHRARQELIRLLSQPELLLAAMELAEECKEKLSGWRGAAAYALVGEIDPATPGTDLAARVARAQRTLDGHNDNQYFKQGYRQFQMLLLKWHLIASIAVILLVSVSNWPIENPKDWYNASYAVRTGRLSSLINDVESFLGPDLEAEEEGAEDLAEEMENGDDPEEEGGATDPEPERPGAEGAGEGDEVISDADENELAEESASEEDAPDEGKIVRAAALAGASSRTAYRPANRLELLMAVLLFGWLGGSFSALTSLASKTAEQKIPAETMETRVTLLRPLMGAGGAFIIYLTLLAGFPVSGWISSPSVLVFAIAAGFSERFAVRVVDRVSGGGA